MSAWKDVKTKWKMADKMNFKAFLCSVLPDCLQKSCAFLFKTDGRKKRVPPPHDARFDKLDTYIQSHYERVSYSVRCTPNHPPTTEEIETAIKEKEIFAEYFFALLAEKGLSDVEAYKKARIDRRIFSKIRSQKDYMPSKKTLLAFVIALELNPDEANELLKHGGYYLSNTRKDDVIIEYFLESKCYDFDLINEALARYGFSSLNEQ